MKLVAVTVFTILLIYGTSCWIFPFKPCRACSGLGRRDRSDRKAFRDCWWCKGTGRRLRWGRRGFNAAKRRRDAGRGR